MFEKLKTTWTTGSDAVGGFSDGAAGLTEAFAEIEGDLVTEAFADGEGDGVIEIDVLFEQTVSLVALQLVSTTCGLEHVEHVLQEIESAVAEHVPPL
jgi:hypothetical protein